MQTKYEAHFDFHSERSEAKGSRGELEAPFAEFPSRVANLPSNATGSLDCARDDISV